MHGWDPSSFILTWVHDKNVINITNCSTIIKDFNNEGALLAYQIPKELSPSLPAETAIDKYDNNYGVSYEWVKIVMHLKKKGSHNNFNLPRLFWAKKSWTLVELHHHVFNHFKNLFTRWYQALHENSPQRRSRHDPEYEFNGKKLDFHSSNELFESGDLAA